MTTAALQPVPTRRSASLYALLVGCTLALAACALRGADSGLSLVTGAGAPLTLERTLEEVQLRGFGAVSGRLWRAADGSSVLEIRCASPERAQLTQAKYLSDLQLLPGVTAATLVLHSPPWGEAPLALRVVKDQGEVLALRAGSTLFIAAARDHASLQQLLHGGFIGNAAGAATTAEVAVPMWLDRFDRFGFRFYYAPFTQPPPSALADGAKPSSWDPERDFAFAKENGAGLVLWATQSMQGASEGVTNASWWSWVERWAEPLGLPLGINLSAYNYDLPNWVANRFRGALAQPMPDYLGDSMSIAGGRGTGGKVGELAWGATPARDAMFGSLQQTVRRLAAKPNVVSWLEPHGEFYQGGDAFMGYGPAVDATFRDFLKGRYRTVAALNSAWHAELPGFEAVRAPELAEFAGWTPEAIDLAGNWRVGYPKAASHPEWCLEEVDDRAWPVVVAPGDDHAFFTPREPAIFRRALEVPAARLGGGARWWLYLWDLNTAWDKPVAIWLNSHQLGESPCRHPHPHWMVAEATSALRPGANQVALTLPNGYLGYRVYLSPVPPRQYPALGPGLDAKWVDYVAWREQARMAAARRGVEMIREVDPERQIDFMAPGESADGLKDLAEGFGGNFKDTGFMAGVWAELLPSLMRGSRLPFSLEPGGPPRTVPEMRRMLGLYHSEAIQAMDYFIHIGDVEWNPEIRQAFHETLPLWHAFGKYHCHPADLAVLWHMGIDAITGFPWGGDLNTNTWSGWACRQVPESLLETHPRDGITEGDFARGNASAYKVVIDTNTSIMDPQLLAEIERYVRGGGIFITTGQSGRHGPAAPDSWPISTLTGYQVLSHETFPPETNGGKALPPPPGSPGQTLAPAAGQPVYAAQDEWMKDHYLSGLRLKRVASDAQDLLLWQDGSVAVGMRQLGKGRIIHFGCKEPGGGMRIRPQAFFPILDWAGVRRNQATVSVSCADDAKYARGCIYREYVSNNGLYDVWMLFNDNRDHAVEAAITFGEHGPHAAYDVLGGTMLAVSGGRLTGIALPPLATRMFLTPRARIAEAAVDWFSLQRGWWRGTTPVSRGFPAPSTRYHMPLDADWSWRAVGAEDRPETWAGAAQNSAGWAATELSVLSSPQRPGLHHVALRRTFSVPAGWNAGRVALSLRSSGYPDFAGSGRLWLDGALMQNWGMESVDQIGSDSLRAGSSHTLLLEVKSEGGVVGLPGNAWLSYIPAPERSIDLAGSWATAADMLHITGEVHLPGPYSAKVLRRTITVPGALKERTAVVTMESTRAFGLIVNGTYLPFSGGPAKNGNVMAVTPFLRYDADNIIELVSPYDHCEVRRVTLDFYDPALGYP